MMPEAKQPVLGVSDCIAFINQTLEYAYPTVVVEGEVASFKLSKGKFVFFDLKDAEGVLSCFMMAHSVRFALEDGMNLRVTALPRLTSWGKFSLTVRELTPVGEGSIKRSFELLRARLEKEGLFDAARKRTLPQFPEKVGVISSIESAGYADFIKILHNRWGGAELQVADVQVQGSVAAEQLLRALRYFNEQAEPVDAVVLIRGGGSAEDLAVFNDELLVRAVAASRIPTLVGVGHEVDISLCDLAADVRAATPSNAAELLVPDRHALLTDLVHRERHLSSHFRSQLTQRKAELDQTERHCINRLCRQLEVNYRDLNHAGQLLKQLDPKMVLRRGYALVRDDQHRVVKGSGAHLKPGDPLTIELERAIITAGVTHVKAKK